MLIEYYGSECGHCRAMEPLLKRLEEEFGVHIVRKETWHDPAHEAERAERDQGTCGGVPFFVNTDTGATLCGEASYEELKAWAGVPS